MDIIEIEGKKYQANPENPSEALKDDAGNPVPYEEPQEPETPPADTPQATDPSKMTLEELKKLNPDVARLVSDADDARKNLEEAERERQQQEEEKLREQGKWQELADKERERREKAEADAAKMKGTLEGYQGTVKKILDSALSQIPEEKKKLIPEQFTVRQKLDYVIENAEWLGVSLASKGAPVPPNEAPTPTDEEGKLQTELNELMSKESRTFAEDQRMLDVSKKLKEVRNAKEESKKA